MSPGFGMPPILTVFAAPYQRPYSERANATIRTVESPSYWLVPWSMGYPAMVQFSGVHLESQSWNKFPRCLPSLYPRVRHDQALLYTSTCTQLQWHNNNRTFRYRNFPIFCYFGFPVCCLAVCSRIGVVGGGEKDFWS